MIKRNSKKNSEEVEASQAVECEVVTTKRKSRAKLQKRSAAFPHEMTTENMRKFIGEYLRDFNILRAVKRMGNDGDIETLINLANTFFNQPYVQNKLLERIAKLDPGDLVTPSQVMAGMLECANDHTDPRSNSVTRAAAWREIARMLGMYEIEDSGSVSNSPAMINLTISNDKITESKP